MPLNSSGFLDNYEVQRVYVLKRVLLGSAILISIILITFPLVYTLEERLLNFVVSALFLVFILICTVLVHYNYIDLSIHIMISAIISLIFINNLPFGVKDPTILAFIIPIALSSFLLKNSWTYFYTFIIIGLYTTLIFLNPTVYTTLAIQMFASVIGSGIILIIAVILIRNADYLQGLNRQALQQNTELAQIRQHLEDRVEERTATLQQTLNELQTSSETIRQLTVPLLRVEEGVLLLPLLGTISAQRAGEIEQFVLDQVYTLRPHTVIIDLTGLLNINQQFMHQLSKIITAIHLLGIQTILVGIHAEIALSMLEQNQALANVVIKRDVQQGLAYATHYAQV